MQLVYNIIRFKLKKLKHRSAAETAQVLFARK